MKKYTLICFSLVLTCACAQTSKKLDNSTALKGLRVFYKKSCKSEIVDYFSSLPNNPNYYHYEYYTNELKKKGLITLSKRKYKNGKVGLKIDYTDLAAQKYRAGPGFYSFKAEVFKFSPMEIIGISHHNGNKADVLFKGNMEPTIFYKIVKKNSKCKQLKDMEQKVTFIRYDTGWRIE